MGGHSAGQRGQEGFLEEGEGQEKDLKGVEQGYTEAAVMCSGQGTDDTRQVLQAKYDWPDTE